MITMTAKTCRNASTPRLLDGYSIEMVPHTANLINDLSDILPPGTRVYLAHIEGTANTKMVETAAQVKKAGFDVMPHFPARLIADKTMLADWIARYQGQADVRQALVLAGGSATACGAFSDSMQLLETGLFDKAGFTHLHIAGHPEGSRDIDPDGAGRKVTAALRWKQEFSSRTNAQMGITTQFFFDATPVLNWAETLRDQGITLPIHLGVAGPTRLRMLIKYANACGVGPSLKALTAGKWDLRNIFLPYNPARVLSQIAAYKKTTPDCAISTIHFFPFGGIEATASWVRKNAPKL
jgi:methylenetetrahydrofolate reductase (NADPH)